MNQVLSNLSLNQIIEMFMDKDKLIAKLEYWRKANNLTQAEISQRLGVAQPYYSAMINNSTAITFERIKDFYETLGIDFEDVIIPDHKLSNTEIHTIITSLEEQNQKNSKIIDLLKNKLKP